MTITGILLTGCGTTDLEKLEGHWNDGEGTEYIFYAPDGEEKLAMQK